MLSGVRLKQKVSPLAVKLNVVGNISRLSILYLLAHEPMSVADIIGRVKLSAPLVSHHLKKLYAAGWVRKTVYGKLVTYYLEDAAYTQIKTFILAAGLTEKK